MPLTNPNIDTLAGDELFIAVAESCGYTRLEYKGAFSKYVGTDKHNQRLTLPNYLDEGAAFRLLMSLPGSWWVIESGASTDESDDWIVVSDKNGPRRMLATGPRSEAASVMLKAWLKLKNRGE